MDDRTGSDGRTAAEDRKRVLRAAARANRARRLAADPAGRDRRPEAWTEQLLTLDAVAGARVVAAYVSYGTEPPTAHLVERLVERGTRVLLPVLLEDRDLDWRDLDGGTGGTSAPLLGRGAIGTADVVVLPALLVGRDGARLGQGGGSYDRALARVAAGTPLVALVHDDEVVAGGEVPREPHDRDVTHVVTPTRALLVGGAADGR